MIRLSIINEENYSVFDKIVPNIDQGTLTNFVLENTRHFGIQAKDNDIVRLIPSKKELGEFEVRIGFYESNQRLVVCPVGKVLAPVNPESQKVVDMDAAELFASPF